MSLVKYWPAGLTPLPFQKDAVEWALARAKTYLALDAGLGKTICAALILNRLQREKPTLAVYVCPPFLVSNTIAEFEKWCFEGSTFLCVVPDSRIAPKKSRGGKRPAKTPVIEAMEKELEEWDGDLVLFIDEAHRFKNLSTGRTKALFKFITPHFERVVCLSGTPLPNSRAKELWAIMLYLATDVFGTRWFPYALKYCGAFKTDFGWDFDGFTNRKEFKARAQKSFMLRLKKDVLDLPPKMEGLLTVGEKMPAVVSGLEKQILKDHTEADLMEGKIAAANGADALHLATYLRLLGEYKCKAVLPYIESLLEETDENILIFGVHKETIKKLQYALADYKPLVITGDVPTDKRQGIVKTFQEDKTRRVFIGNIQACGVGFTLTKATRVIFVEFSWVDGENTQASDRAHRIGQKSSVLVQYVVLKDSIDRKRMEVLLNKRNLSI